MHKPTHIGEGIPWPRRPLLGATRGYLPRSANVEHYIFDPHEQIRITCSNHVDTGAVSHSPGIIVDMFRLTYRAHYRII